MRLFPLALLMLAVALLAASCGGSSDSAMPTAQAQAGPDGASSSTSSTPPDGSSASSSSAAASTSSSITSASMSSGASSSSPAPNSGSSSTSATPVVPPSGSSSSSSASSSVSSSATAGTPSYDLIDLGGGSTGGEALQWAQPIPCNLNGRSDVTSITCGNSGTLLVGAVRTSGQDQQHAALIGAPCPASANSCSGMTFNPPVDLGALPGSVWSAAQGANNGNVIVGSNGPSTADNLETSSYAVEWTLAPGASPESGPWSIHQLDNLMHAPTYSAAANGVNEAGEIVGFSQVVLSGGSTAERAALWSNGQVYELQDTLVGAPQIALTDALWIDCQGDIAALGFPLAAPNASHYYLLRRVGTLRTCPTP